MGLLGCESEPATENTMANFRAAMINAVGLKFKRWPADIAFARVETQGVDIDPFAEMVLRRLSVLMRT